jgi:peptidoglycan/xylan/chitin deacetylase (PgdA/CDA1 family)
MSIRSTLRIRSRLRSVVHRVRPPKPKPLILMYHRIADNPVDYWGLAVSPDHFDEHLHVLRRTRYPMPLKDFVRDLIAGTLRSDAVALTFDDGYVDNLIVGKPRLAAADVPANVFLATGHLDRPGEFWWDELTQLVFLANGPRNFELTVRGKSMHFELSTESPVRDRRTSQTGVPKGREVVLTAIWRAIRLLEEDERELIMVELRSILSVQREHTSECRAMTRDEVRRLASDGLVTIGAHTVTHPVMPELTPAARDREISESKFTCEELVGTSAVGFAYPYGDFCENDQSAVMAAGLAFACSTQYGPTSGAYDLFALPRINIQNWGGDAFERTLRSPSGLT